MSKKTKMARPTGLEPVTLGLEGRCSIQMSYGRFVNSNRGSASYLKWSGQRDSNSRPSGPKPDALPDCAMPRHIEEQTSSKKGEIIR